jgi:hypothetical protein
MTSEQLEFHNVFLNRGGLFDSKRFGEFSRYFEYTKMELYQRVKVIRSVDSKLPAVYIDFIDNDKFNAVATKKEDRYYIGINWGSVLILYDLFQRIMTSPKIFPHIGDASKEEIKKIYNPLITEFSKLILSNDLDRGLGPKDVERKSHAATLTSLAIGFLFLHEYGHILNGHIDLKGNLFNSFSLSEMENDSNSFTPLNSQTIEVDADRFATTFSIWFLDMSNHKNFESDTSAAEKFCLSHFEKQLETLSFAIYSLFRIFDHKTHTLDEMQKKSHPTEVIRLDMYFLVMHSILHHRLGNKVNEIMAKTIVNVENAFLEISESFIEANYLNVGYTKMQKEFLSLILKNWNTLRECLESYAYMKLPPSQNDLNA